MPYTIAPVVWGRCRPTPDRVSEGASPDRDSSGIVTGHLPVRGGQRLVPVVHNPAPRVRVGGVHGPCDFVPFRARGQRVARLTAETTAFREARVVLASMPMPHRTFPSMAHSMYEAACALAPSLIVCSV